MKVKNFQNEEISKIELVETEHEWVSVSECPLCKEEGAVKWLGQSPFAHCRGCGERLEVVE